MDTIYIVQIDMADKNSPPAWSNMGAYCDYPQAEAQIRWLKTEYGDEIDYRIDVINFYPAA